VEAVVASDGRSVLATFAIALGLVDAAKVLVTGMPGIDDVATVATDLRTRWIIPPTPQKR
jgi:hypothetical protein